MQAVELSALAPVLTTSMHNLQVLLLCTLLLLRHECAACHPSRTVTSGQRD